MARILVIDDENDLLEEIVDWLTFEGFTVYRAGGGSEGIRLARLHLPDLIVCDIMMPYVDGYRVLLELRATPATAQIPFVFLSALSDRRAVRRGMNLGADDYVLKPVARIELLDTVHTRLEKDAEARQRAAAALDELRMGLSLALPHELRTPLVGIIGFGELLALDAASYTPPQVAEMATTIVNSGERLLRLIDNYLLFVQLELTKDREFTTEVGCDAGVVGGHVARQVAEQRTRAADLTVELADAVVAMDGESFEKVVAELVDNAFKFSKPGTPVRITGELGDGEWLLCVADRGIGFQPEDVRRIDANLQFQRSKYEQQGVGLGLAIAKRLVERYRGVLEIESCPGEGARICVKAPLLAL